MVYNHEKQEFFIVAAGVSTALASPFVSGYSNSYYEVPTHYDGCQQCVERGSHNEGEYSKFQGAPDNNYVRVKTTILDLANELAHVSRDFSHEESSGYRAFVDDFFS